MTKHINRSKAIVGGKLFPKGIFRVVSSDEELKKELKKALTEEE